MEHGQPISHDFSGGQGDQVITGGVIYRMNDAIVPVMQLQQYRFTLGLSYDVSIDKLAVAARYRGGFELVLSYRDFLHNRNTDRRQMMCPRF